MDNERIVISAPRSGLNWLRICVEFFCMVRTPGKPILIPKSSAREAFWRTHDATGVLGKTHRSWAQTITPEQARGRRTILLIRDPKELMGRMVVGGDSEEKRELMMKAFVGNLNVFAGIGGDKARAFYYDDYITSPDVMHEMIQHLDLKGRKGGPLRRPRVKRFWKHLGGLSRELYATNHASGSMTKKNPTNMSAHQSALTGEHVGLLESTLAELTPAARQLLTRYKLDR